MKRIGAESGAMISMAGPVITILLSALFLGEHLSRIQWTGCLVVLMVITFMEYRKLIIEKT
ncbi:EamA family transporter [Bacillus atrophaeus]|uniref:EamA family transporter n=1 Tax=Bacillus atrophaeus TaxID=1452 RepID=UPI00399CDD5B